jgi:uncharacterized protein YqjF (DUF2071 family)
MRWCDLAFLHWPVAPQTLRSVVPEGLHIDTFDGVAWIGVVPFRMEGVRLRAAPPVPTTQAFPEINVRTYVRAVDRAGVWFFSLDAASRLAVRGARFLYNLPYFDAEISVVVGPSLTMSPPLQEGWVDYDSRRVHRHAAAARFKARYGPTGAVYEPAPGTLDHFLVERYCLFTYDARRGLGLLDVDHPPWPLQRGAAAVSINTMVEAAGIDLPATSPLVHFARALDVRVWPRRGL